MQRRAFAAGWSAALSSHGLTHAAVTVLVLASAISSWFAFSPAHAGTAAFWGAAVVPAVVIGVVAIAWGAHETLLREWLSPRWGDFTQGLIAAGALLGAAWAFVHVVAPVGSPREIWLVSVYNQLGDPRVLQQRPLAVAGAIVGACAGEEIFWRGMVTHVLARRVGSRTAWLWAAGLYAVSYTPTAFALRTPNGENPLLVVAALGGGLLWGAMVRASGRLPPALVAHALFDWAAVMMFPLWGRVRF